MKHSEKIVAALVFGITSCGLAATVDFTGQNLWGQYGGLYGGTVTTVNASTNEHASGNASMVFDVADGAGLSVPQAVFSSPIVGGIVTITMKIYFPSTSQGAFLLGCDDAVGPYVQLSSYVAGPTGGFGYAEGGTGGLTYVRDQWKTLKFVIDLDSAGSPPNGTYYYDDMINPAGTFPYASDTVAELWFLVGNNFNGTPVTGPFYFDDMVVRKGETVIWSDNFDSYFVPVVPPELRITSVEYNANEDALRLIWNSEPGASYNIEATQEFGNPLLAPPHNVTVWDNVTTGIPSGGGSTTRVIDAPQPGSFYRIRKL